jgi:hypothetical protein
MTETQQNQQTSKTTISLEQKDQSSSSIPRQIFREHALQHYTQKNEKNVLPRTISPFMFICCWIALTLTILASLLIWSIPVPNYLDTLGIPTPQGSPGRTTQTTSILVFFPVSAQAYIRPGQVVQISGNTIDYTLAGRITHVDTQHLNMTELGKRYAFKPEMVQFLPATTDVFVGTITTSQAIPLKSDTSDRITVHYQQGTRQALSLLLDLSNQ